MHECDLRFSAKFQVQFFENESGFFVRGNGFSGTYDTRDKCSKKQAREDGKHNIEVICETCIWMFLVMPERFWDSPHDLRHQS